MGGTFSDSCHLPVRSNQSPLNHESPQNQCPLISMDFDFHWSEFNSRYLRLILNSASSFFPSTFYKRHHLLPWNKTYQLPPLRQGHHFPVEIFSEIFLYTARADPCTRTNLMLVCRHWYEIMLSTPGVHSQLRIDRWTRKQDVERFGRRWLLDVTIDMGENWDRFSYNHVKIYGCFMAAAEAASRWRSLVLVSLPPPGEYRDLQIIHPLQHLEYFKIAASCKLGNFLEPLITAITTTVTPRFTVMEVFQPDAALYLLQPAHFHIFSSLRVGRSKDGALRPGSNCHS